MAKVIIIADDLTGANATGALFARSGYRAATFLDVASYNRYKNRELDVVSISTDSRAVSPREAYTRVREVAAYFTRNDPPRLFAKRIDTTLRGNIGAETDALLDELGAEYTAVVVPAFPSSGRINIGGYLLVHGVPLARTDVARDPKTPVHTSFSSAVISRQSRYPVSRVDFSEISKEADQTARALQREKEKGSRIILFDAASEEDIAAIAAGVNKLAIPVISVDPGPFSLALSKILLGGGKRPVKNKVFVTIGSTTKLTRQQLAKLEEERDTHILQVSILDLLAEDKKEKEIERVKKALLERRDHDIIGVVSARQENDIIDLKNVARMQGLTEEEVSSVIARGLAAITTRVMTEDRERKGLFVSGGDITVAICQESGAAGIEVVEDIIPLAVYGKILGGVLDNNPIITKGGLIGDVGAISLCVGRLLDR